LHCYSGTTILDHPYIDLFLNDLIFKLDSTQPCMIDYHVECLIKEIYLLNRISRLLITRIRG
jgi:hypothetical protein